MQVDFSFAQYLGFLAFLGIASMGFWLMILLLTYIVPMWVGGALWERFTEKNHNKE